MLKVTLGLLMMTGWVLSSPVARFDHRQSADVNGGSFLLVTGPNEIAADGRSFKTGGNNVNKRVDFDGGPNDFVPIHPPPHHPEGDPYVGPPENAVRALNTPLFFDTFDHGHMMTNYAQRRQQLEGGAPLRFRSIRPDFPFSDISRRGG